PAGPRRRGGDRQTIRVPLENPGGTSLEAADAIASRLQNDLSRREPGQKAQGRNAVRGLAPVRGDPDVGLGARCLVPVLNRIATESRESRQGLLVAIPDRVPQSQGAKERGAGRAARGERRNAPEALEAREVSAVEVHVEDGSPSPERGGVERPGPPQ